MIKYVAAFLLLCPSLLQALTLSWTANVAGDNVTAYNVYLSGSHTILLGTVAAPVTSFSLDGVSGNKLTLYVTAVNVSGESRASAKVVVQRRGH